MKKAYTKWNTMYYIKENKQTILYGKLKEIKSDGISGTRVEQNARIKRQVAMPNFWFYCLQRK